MLSLIKLISDRYSQKMSDSITPTVKLNNGVKIPFLGLQLHKDDRNDDLKRIKSRITLFDCTENEKLLGEAIVDRIIERDEIFITYKLRIMNSYESGSIETVIRTILNNLRIDYFDLCLLEWTPNLEHDTKSLMDFWTAMEEIYKKNLTRAIGTAYFNIEQIEQILGECHVLPSINQIRNSSEFLLRRFCENHGIKIIYPAHLVKIDDRIDEIAKRYSKDPLEILLRYHSQVGNVVLLEYQQLEEWIFALHFKGLDFHLAPEDACYINSFV